MKVDSISTHNLDMLYRKVATIFSDAVNWNKYFQGNFNKFLNHVSIEMDLSEVSEYDYIFLKMFTSSISKFKRSNFQNTKDIIYDLLYPEVKEKLQNVHNLIDSMDSSIKYDRMFIPSGCLFGSCHIRLTGYQLMVFIENPSTFFVNITNKECLNEAEFMNIEYSTNFSNNLNDIIANGIIRKFFDSFYKFMLEKITYRDLLSDSCIFSLLQDFTHEENGLNKCIKNNNIKISSFEDSINIIDATDNSVVNFSGWNSLLYGKPNLSDIKITFNLVTSFGTYFDLMNLLPLSSFISSQSIQVINKQKTIDNIYIPPELSGFNARLTKVEKELLTCIIDNYNSSGTILKMCEMSMNSYLYNYSLSVSLNDINTHLVNNSLDKDDCFYNETNSIINEIINIGVLIYKYFYNK